MGRFDGMTERFNQHDAESGGFLKFEDGDIHLVVFLGAPHIRETYWEGGKTHAWTEGCGKEKVLKTSMNVAVLEKLGDDTYRILGHKILENSKTFYRDVAKMDAKYGVDTRVFEIERDGKDKNTKYSILPDGKISETLRAELDAFDLFDLTREGESEEGGAKPGVAGKGSPSGASRASRDEPAPIVTQADGNSLIERLKALKATLGPQGDTMMADFLALFGIGKIRDLPAGRLKEAQRWITLEEEAARHAAADGAEPGDPFA